jgi:ABC-type glycerol-3-phosphate transport system substrate-binding protein
MAEGKAAHMVTYNWMMPRFNDPKQSKIVGKVALTLAPGGHGNQGGWGWGIPRSAPNKDAAWKFLAWVESFDVAKRRALAGGSPTRSDVFGDPDVLAKYPHYPTVLKLIATAKAVPLYTGTNQMYVVLAREFSQVLAGQKDPKTALGIVNKELDELAKDDPFVKRALNR